MTEKIAGYAVTSSAMATTCKLYFATKRKRRYVIKEYTKVRFLTGKSRAQMKRLPHLMTSEKRAQAFWDHLRGVTRLMQRNCRMDGLLNVPVRVFRRGPFIYKVTRLIEESGLSFADLHKSLSGQQMTVFLRSILTQLDTLERLRFVDLDLKPDNLMIQKKGTCYTACLIDYETGYVVGKGGERQEMEYTPEFAAPELLRYQQLLENGDASDPDYEGRLSAAYDAISFPADIFSAGCVFVYAMTGQYLCADGECASLPGGLLLLERPLWVPKFHPVWRMTVKEMLRADPRLRPAARFILQMMEKARRAGVLQALEQPFARAEAYQLDQTERWLSEQRMRTGRYEGQPCALWHLDDCWQGEEAAELTGKTLWGRLNIAAERRLNYLQSILETVRVCAGECPAIPRAWLDLCPPVSFCRQETPPGPWRRLRDAVPSGLPPEKADQLMLELLSAVGALHGHELLQCVMAEDDLWLYQDTGGEEHVFLARPHRFLRWTALPPPQDIDAPPRLMPVEMYVYLGSQDPDQIADYAACIGPETDIFVLGLMYHLLLCGRWPRMADADAGCLGLAAMDGGMLLDSRIDPPRQSAIRKMTAFEPEDRPHDCAEAARLVPAKRQAQPREEPPRMIRPEEAAPPVPDEMISLDIAEAAPPVTDEMILLDIAEAAPLASDGMIVPDLMDAAPPVPEETVFVGLGEAAPMVSGEIVCMPPEDDGPPDAEEPPAAQEAAPGWTGNIWDMGEIPIMILKRPTAGPPDQPQNDT